MGNNYTPNYTHRLLVRYSVDQQKTSSLLRIVDDDYPGNLDDVLEAYLDCLAQLYSMPGLCHPNRIARIVFLSAERASRGSNVFVPQLRSGDPVVTSGTGAPTVRNLLSLMSISGRTVAGTKVLFYFVGVTADVGAGELTGSYSDMRLDSSEVSGFGAWFNAFWVPGETLFDSLVGPDNQPLAFMRPQLNVRFSARKTNTLRKL